VSRFGRFSRIEAWFTMTYRAKVYEFQSVGESFNIPPKCRCGATMKVRGGYVMGGESDWMGYQCPRDRWWNYRRHPILTLRRRPPPNPMLPPNEAPVQGSPSTPDNRPGP